MISRDVVVDHNEYDDDYQTAEVLKVCYILYTISLPCIIITLGRRKLCGWGIGDQSEGLKCGVRRQGKQKQ